MSNGFFTESRKKIESPFVLRFVTSSRTLSPSERKGPLLAFVLHWRDIVAEKGGFGISGGRGTGIEPAPLCHRISFFALCRVSLIRFQLSDLTNSVSFLSVSASVTICCKTASNSGAVAINCAL